MKRSSNRGCLFYGGGFFVGLPLLLLAIGLLVITGQERASKRKLIERIDKIVAQGLPVDDSTMLSFTNSLTSKEDTKEWLAVLGELTSDGYVKSAKGIPLLDPLAEEERVVPAPGQAWGYEKVTRDFISNWNDLRSKVLKLSLKQLEPGAKPVRFITEFNAVNTLLPQTQNVRSAAQLLQLNGRVEVYDRNSPKTRLSIEALLGCSRTIAGEPILVSQLVQSSIEGMGIDVLRTAVENDVLNEKDLLVLLPRILDGINIRPQWKFSLQGERALMLPAFRHPELLQRSDAIRWLPGRSADALHYLDFMDQILAVPDGDFDEFKSELLKLEQNFHRDFDGNMLQKYDSVMTMAAIPAAASIGDAFIRDAMQRRLAAVCIGVRLYEKRVGKMPASLDDLKSLELGKLSLEAGVLLPLGKKPFGYRVEDSHTSVWGFDSSQDSSTPAEPPGTDDGSYEAQRNRLWLWALEHKKKE